MKTNKKELDNFYIATKIFESLQLVLTVGIKNENYVLEDQIVESLIERTNDRQDLLDIIIEYIGKADTFEKKELRAKALSWSRVHRNKEAIDAIEKLLESNIDAKDFTKYSRGTSYPLITDKKEIEKRIYISDLKTDLSKKYMREYMFEQALAHALDAVELTPFYAHTIINLTVVYERINQLGKAKEVYENTINGDYFNLDTIGLDKHELYVLDSFKKVITGHYEKLLDKIERNYIYRPRKKKELLGL